jgi:glutathionylspermidine synthase
MKRASSSPRPDWPTRVESQGLAFHSNPVPYWDETACYEFTAAEVDVLEQAGNELYEMCIKAAEYVIRQDLFATFGIDPDWKAYVVESWERDDPSIYGRFDLAFDGSDSPRLLEFNADTPTALLEAAVIQWHWLQDRQPGADQFNSIHERLIERWGDLARTTDGILYFAAISDSVEDWVTVNYLRDTAMQAGLNTAYLAIEQIGWDTNRSRFVDLANRPISNIFKLYPWEWLMRERFGPHVLERHTAWFEPPWKMLLSNKAILPILWRLFPGHRALLRSEFEPFGQSYVRKPCLGREGANIQIVFDGEVFLQTEGDYEGPFIYQEICPLPKYDGGFPVIGCWTVAGTACGIGIRESDDLITRNTSRFVPHLFR